MELTEELDGIAGAFFLSRRCWESCTGIGCEAIKAARLLGTALLVPGSDSNYMRRQIAVCEITYAACYALEYMIKRCVPSFGLTAPLRGVDSARKPALRVGRKPERTLCHCSAPISIQPRER